MDEKISNKLELARKFDSMIINEEEFFMGRNEYQIKCIDGEWQMIKKTPAGNYYKTDMQVNTLLYHLSREEKA
jgi:hypothetical protein